LVLILGALSACQLQLNQSKGLFLKVVLPSGISKGAKNLAANSAAAKSIAGPSGTCVQVTIMTQSEAPWASSEAIPTNGNSSVSFTFPLPPPGSYMASAELLDASGILLDQTQPASFTVPSQTNPVVMTLQNTNLYSMVVTDYNSVPYELTQSGTSTQGFAPTVYNYYSNMPLPPYTLTLRAVDAGASIAVSQDDGTGTYVPVSSVSPGVYQFTVTNAAIAITITSSGGSFSSSYGYNPWVP